MGREIGKSVRIFKYAFRHYLHDAAWISYMNHFEGTGYTFSGGNCQVVSCALLNIVNLEANSFPLEKIPLNKGL